MTLSCLQKVGVSACVSFGETQYFIWLVLTTFAAWASCFLNVVVLTSLHDDSECFPVDCALSMRVIRRDSVSYLACFNDFRALSKLLPLFFVLFYLHSELFPVDWAFSMRVIQPESGPYLSTTRVFESKFWRLLWFEQAASLNVVVLNSLHSWFCSALAEGLSMRVIRPESVHYLALFDDFCGLNKLLPQIVLT